MTHGKEKNNIYMYISILCVRQTYLTSGLIRGYIVKEKKRKKTTFMYKVIHGWIKKKIKIDPKEGTHHYFALADRR
jgi:hypothetical protein